MKQGPILLTISRKLDYIIRQVERRLPDDLLRPSKFTDGNALYAPVLLPLCRLSKTIRRAAKILSPDEKMFEQKDLQESTEFINGLYGNNNLDPMTKE
jgi:hypothetical protein